ncbi:MAG: SAM-dependent chlorinase/fluorinase [Planctomycetota bacterium]|nr:SAM-dependent chlorinase/fluorinase [Planctomycetota bacterium]
MPPIVTLITDFGSGSGYVAEMKGRLLHAKTPFRLIDIAHDVPPHDVRAAAWLVGQACSAFPANTLHLNVVDPGVGTSRRLIWARIGTQQFIAPDNGVLSWATTKTPLAKARILTPPMGIAATFHGRDAIAPLAVEIIDGAAPESLGTQAGPLVSLNWPQPTETSAGIVGEVIHVDTFGNLITNLSASLLPRLERAGWIRVGANEIATIVHTYGEAPRDTPVALAGSQGFLEIAVVEGRADTRLAAGVGTAVELP